MPLPIYKYTNDTPYPFTGRIYNKNIKTDYDNFFKYINEILECKFNALFIEDEEIFNKFNKYKSIKDELYDYNIKMNVVNTPTQFFEYIHELGIMKKDTDLYIKIDIYANNKLYIIKYYAQDEDEDDSDNTRSKQQYFRVESYYS